MASQMTLVKKDVEAFDRIRTACLELHELTGVPLPENFDGRRHSHDPAVIRVHQREAQAAFLTSVVETLKEDANAATGAGQQGPVSATGNQGRLEEGSSGAKGKAKRVSDQEGEGQRPSASGSGDSGAV